MKKIEEAENLKWTEILKPLLLGLVFKATQALKSGSSRFEWSLPFRKGVKQILLRLDLSVKVYRETKKDLRWASKDEWVRAWIGCKKANARSVCENWKQGRLSTVCMKEKSLGEAILEQIQVCVCTVLSAHRVQCYPHSRYKETETLEMDIHWRKLFNWSVTLHIKLKKGQ